MSGSTRQLRAMARGVAAVAAALALVVLVVAPAAADIVPPAAPVPHLKIADTIVPLNTFVVSSTTCGQLSPDPNLPGGCVSGDGVLNPRVPISKRVRVPFGGAITLQLAPNTDSV